MFSGSETRRREAAQSEATGSESSEQDGHFHKDVEKTGERAHHHFTRKIFFEKEGEDRHITLKDRLRHFTWAWFTLTMATGGFATLLAVQPHNFSHIRTLGTIVYILDLVFFVFLCAGITTRFIMDPSALRRSLTHTGEALFFPTFWLSLPTIIGGMEKYGAPHVGAWLPVVLRVLFWIYCACTSLVAIFQYQYLFTAKQLTVQSMVPSWILPVFPAMLCGTLASIIASSQPDDQRMPILIAGVTFQGLGMSVAMLMYAVLIARLMEFGLPAPNLRPGLFICVGPPSFTTLALIGMANAVPEGYSFFETYPGAVVVVKTMAVFTGIFLWALAFWWFAIALISTLQGVKEMTFHLVWWSMVFPNVGFTIATIDLGEQLKSQGIQWVGSIMTIFIFITWLFVLCNHAKALLTKRMMMPGLDEDKDQMVDPLA